MDNWEFREGLGLGRLYFGMSMQEIVENISPVVCPVDMASWVSSRFGDRVRSSVFGEENSLFQLELFDIEVGFDEAGLLECIYARDSFILDGVELIGRPSEFIYGLWSSDEIDVTDCGVCVIFDCPVDILISSVCGLVAGVTVNPWSRFQVQQQGTDHGFNQLS